MSIHHLRRRSDAGSSSEWLGPRRRHSRVRGDEVRPVDDCRGSAAGPSEVVVLAPRPESSGPRSSIAATLARLAGRPGAEFMPKGTLRAIVQKAAEAGDREAIALLESGMLGGDPVEG